VSRAPSWKGDPERHAAITVSTKITEILIVGSILELKFFQNLFSADPAGGAYEASQGHVDGGEGTISLPPLDAFGVSILLPSGVPALGTPDG